MSVAVDPVQGFCPICGFPLTKVQEDIHTKAVDQLAAWGCDNAHLFVPGKAVVK